jgi:hypothetical protein
VTAGIRRQLRRERLITLAIERISSVALGGLAYGREQARILRQVHALQTEERAASSAFEQGYTSGAFKQAVDGVRRADWERREVA